MPHPASEFVSPKEAGAFLGISLASVYRLMERQSLAWTKIGGSRRIPRAALEAVARSKFVGDQAVLDAHSSGDSKVSMDSSRVSPSMEQTRRALAERLRRLKQIENFELAYCYRRVLGDLDDPGGEGSGT